MLAIHVIWSHVLHGGCNDMPIRKREVTNNPTYPVVFSGLDWSLDLEAKQNGSG